MVGPPSADSGRVRITRRVETLELRADGGSFHHALDTASVSVERLPPLAGPSSSPGAEDTLRAQPTAVFVVTPLVLLASYQPCGASEGVRGEPRIRYLRRDPKGTVVTDVILWRAPGEPEQGAR